MIHFAPAKKQEVKNDIFAQLSPEQKKELHLVAEESSFPNAVQQLQSFAAVGGLNLETLQQIARRGIPIDVVLRELQSKQG